MTVVGVQKMSGVVTKQMLHCLYNGKIAAQSWLPWVCNSHRKSQRKRFYEASVCFFRRWILQYLWPRIHRFTRQSCCLVCDTWQYSRRQSSSCFPMFRKRLNGLNFFCNTLLELCPEAIKAVKIQFKRQRGAIVFNKFGQPRDW